MFSGRISCLRLICGLLAVYISVLGLSYRGVGGGAQGLTIHSFRWTVLWFDEGKEANLQVFIAKKY